MWKQKEEENRYGTKQQHKKIHVTANKQKGWKSFIKLHFLVLFMQMSKLDPNILLWFLRIFIHRYNWENMKFELPFIWLLVFFQVAVFKRKSFIWSIAHKIGKWHNHSCRIYELSVIMANFPQKEISSWGIILLAIYGSLYKLLKKSSETHVWLIIYHLILFFSALKLVS